MCQKDCPICIEPLFTKTDVRIMRLRKKVLVKRGERLPITKLKCGHSFHKDCIKNWYVKTDIESSTKCPMCRDKIIFKPDSKNVMMRLMRNEPEEDNEPEEYSDTESDDEEDYSNGRVLVNYGRVMVDYGGELVDYDDLYNTI